MWYKITHFRIRQTRRPFGYLASARINGTYTERFYLYKPAQPRTLSDLTSQYEAQERARRAYIIAATPI